MDLEVKLGKEQLAEVEQPDVHISAAEKNVMVEYCPWRRRHADLCTSFFINSAESGFCVS
jgi:hypothetical protein